MFVGAQYILLLLVDKFPCAVDQKFYENQPKPRCRIKFFEKRRQLIIIESQTTQKWFRTCAEIIYDWFDMRPKNFNQGQLYIILYGHVSTWWSFCTLHWCIDKTCTRYLITCLKWEKYPQRTLVNCIHFTTPLIFNFNTLLNISPSLLTYPTKKGMLTCLCCAIPSIENFIMNQQEEKYNSISNNIAHIGNYCGVIGSQNITVSEWCDPNHWIPEKINTITEADNISVHRK